MNGKINIRKCLQEEIEWINKKYDEIKFKHSNYSNEYIVIAEFNGNKAGIGRLQKIDETTSELGGIYVFKEFRKLGIARRMVCALLENSNIYCQIYCLPFECLENFYKQFGFIIINDKSEAPKEIYEKWQWCNSYYESKTLLLCKYNNKNKSL